MKKSIIYSDGSCINNPGKGGWAFLAIEQNIEWYVSGYEEHTTNNRMELLAVIEALLFILNDNCTIYSDSKYVINCASGKWRRNSNLDLWEKFDIASKNKCITWNWVKGHSGNKFNEIVDNIARNETL